MKLSDAMAATEPPRRRSKMEQILDSLSEEDRELVLYWIYDHRFSNQRIAKALSLAGHEVSRDSVGQYRSRLTAKGRD